MSVKCIAECGANHAGSLQTAKDMVTVLASYVKCDVVKFQKRTTSEMPEEVRSRPYTGQHSFGATYGEHRDALELDMDEHRELKKFCEQQGVEYSCSVWDTTAAMQIAELKPSFIKIPSACNLDFDMINVLLSCYKGDIHISLGMTTANERERIKCFIRDTETPERFVVYFCTSAYPCEYEDVYMQDLWIGKYWRGSPGIKNYGFSGHHKGIAIDMAAVAMNIEYLERHFTLDRTAKGTDHAASLEPDGMRKLVRDVRNTEAAFKHRNVGLDEVLPCEEAPRKKMKTCVQ